ncbi:MAG: hypothetical protein V4671_16485 [Armatimonadota bacterium]
MSNSPQVFGGPSGLSGPSIYLKLGDIDAAGMILEPVYLQCTGAQDDYTCTLLITLGRATPRRPSGRTPGFADISGDELREYLEKAQASLAEIRALTTADFLTRRSGQSLQQSPLPDEDLLMWRADMVPFAKRHRSCRRAIEFVDSLIEAYYFQRYLRSERQRQGDE